MTLPLRAAALSLALLGAAPALAAAQTAPMNEGLFRTTTFSLAAEGKTRLAPDQATIGLGVTREGPTASAAMQASAQAMTAALASLKRSGIAERDIQTSGLSLEPQYTYRENLPPKLTGYRASQQLTIIVRELSRVGAAADAAVNAGANQVSGISFGLGDSTAAENTAREAAVRALQAKADLYARATGYRIVRLISLSEGASPVVPPPMPMPVMAMARMEKAQTPIAPGEMEVQVQVNGVYELAR